MGYQEAFRPIQHLAESAGIKKAIEEYKDNPHLPEYCLYACTARNKETGALYACIIGQRCRVSLIAGIFLDYCIPYDAEYTDYYEDLDERLVEAAAQERPDLVEKAYRETVSDFECGVQREMKREQELRKEALELWPHVAKLLLACGPLTERVIASFPSFEGHFMWNVLVELGRQGLIVCDGQWARDDLRLSEKALQEQGLTEPPEVLNEDEMLVFLLSECGPQSTRVLAGWLNTDPPKVLRRLHRLMDEGRVVPEGRGRSRKYRLVEDGKQDGSSRSAP